MEEFGETVGALADTTAVSQFVKSVITDSSPETERFTKELYDSFAVSLCRNLFHKFEAGYNVMVIDESIPRPPKDLWEVNLKGGLTKVAYDRDQEPHGVVYYEGIKFGEKIFSVYVFSRAGKWTNLSLADKNRFWCGMGHVSRWNSRGQMSHNGRILGFAPFVFLRSPTFTESPQVNSKSKLFS